MMIEGMRLLSTALCICRVFIDEHETRRELLHSQTGHLSSVARWCGAFDSWAGADIRYRSRAAMFSGAISTLFFGEGGGWTSRCYPPPASRNSTEK